MQCLLVGCWCQRGMTNVLWHLNTDLNRVLNRRALFQRPGKWCKKRLSLHAFESLSPADGFENLTWLGSQPCLGQEVGLVDSNPPRHLYFPMVICLTKRFSVIILGFSGCSRSDTV